MLFPANASTESGLQMGTEARQTLGVVTPIIMQQIQQATPDSTDGLVRTDGATEGGQKIWSSKV